MEVTRGDVVIAAAPGDCGKPRPALVVQSDLLNPTHESIVLCPITTHLMDAPLFRLDLKPTGTNGLTAPSQVMIDKMMALKRDRVRQRVGRLGSVQMSQVDDALLLWLGFESG